MRPWRQPAARSMLVPGHADARRTRGRGCAGYLPPSSRACRNWHAPGLTRPGAGVCGAVRDGGGNSGWTTTPTWRGLRLGTERKLNDGPGRGLVVREPVGVVAAIAPWNNPFGIMTGKLAPPWWPAAP